MHASPPPRTPSASGRLALPIALLALLAACGRDNPPPPAAPSSPAATRPAAPPRRTAVPLEERARFALQRLLRGPLPRTLSFPIPEIHEVNLENARRDLIALAPETEKLLADPALIARVTGSRQGSRNAWHGILDVLALLPKVGPGVLAAWTRPALEKGDVQLARRAVHALAAAGGRAASPLLLDYLARWPRDREAGPEALRTLLTLGSPWRERALALAYARGNSGVWGRVAPSLRKELPDQGARGAQEGERERVEAALVWWALLAQTSGPVPVAHPQRTLSPPWAPARGLSDPATWPRAPEARREAIVTGRFVVPALVRQAGESLPVPAAAAPVLPVEDLVTDGAGPAAQARCVLASRAGHDAYVAAIQQDAHDPDADVASIAEGCMASVDSPAAVDDARATLDQTTRMLERGLDASDTGVLTSLFTLARASPKEAADEARTLLRVGKATSEAWVHVLHAAYAIAAQDDAARAHAWLEDLIAKKDAAALTKALSLLRALRDPTFARALEARLDQTPPAGQKPVWLALVWLYSAPEAGKLPLVQRKAFVDRLVGWIDGLSDAEAATWVPGLLDLGTPGADAYARGLAGGRRLVYVRGLDARDDRVPLEVARALLEPVDASTSPQERHAVLVAAYRNAPAQAAPLLAALAARLPEAVRPETADVLETLRHRAP